MILVTGAGGTVGSEVVQQLQAAGAKFRSGYHSEEKTNAARAKGIDAIVIDFNDAASLEKSFAGIDKLFLLTGGVPNQVEQESNAARTAKKAGVKHIVKLSVIDAENESFSFAKMHRAMEKAVEASGVPWTFLRPNGFMQNMENYSLPTIQSQGAFYSSVGDAKIAHVDVRDIAAAAVKSLTEPGHEGKSYTLTGKNAVSYNEIAQKLSASSGRTINYINVSDADLKQGLLSAGMPEAYADAYLDLMRFYRSGDAGKTSDDFREVTGRDPISFDQYAKDRGSAFA